MGTGDFLLETSTDAIILTGCWKQPDCPSVFLYTYSYYSVNNLEYPVLYFDPLIIGGDRDKPPRKPTAAPGLLIRKPIKYYA